MTDIQIPPENEELGAKMFIIGVIEVCLITGLVYYFTT